MIWFNFNTEIFINKILKAIRQIFYDEERNPMNKEFNSIALKNTTDLYRRNTFTLTTMTVDGTDYTIISVNPNTDASTVSDKIKYLISGK